MNSEKWVSTYNEIHPSVISKVLNGVTLNRSEWKFIPKTEKDYLYALKRLLGIWQEMLREEDAELLSEDGRLHIRQLLSFRDVNFIRPHYILPLLDKIGSPSSKLKALNAYKIVLGEVGKKCMAYDAIFCKPFTDEEKNMDPKETK